MVTLSSADKALKTFYLGVLADQLNVGVNPLLAKIEHTTADVWGKEVKKLAYNYDNNCRRDEFFI